VAKVNGAIFPAKIAMQIYH
jgi:ATP-dependent DNA helicase 2 subunit 2